MNTKMQAHTKTTPSSFLPASTGLLQRKCACGNHTIAGGECEECSKKKRLGLQTKLTIGEPSDVYEQEADRIADQVMAAPAHHALIGALPHIQRLSEHSNGQMDATPASVERVLGSSGRPLETALRQDMEQRFGHDFSRVRVHTDAAAAQSARDVNAHAYTVGQDIVFGAGRFAPGTHQGQWLIAHELSHTLQQRDRVSLRKGCDTVIQRFVACEDPEDCPAREPGEIGRSRSEPMELFEITSGGIGLLISNFSVGASSIRGDLTTNARWNTFVGEMAVNPNITWEIFGFTDCQGDETLNTNLRVNRATTLYLALPTSAMAQVESYGAAPLTDCIRNNASEENRRLNRSAVIWQKSVSYVFEDEEVKRKPPQKEKTLPGKDFRVDAPASPAWVPVTPTYVFTIKGEPQEFPHYLKVRVEDATGSKWNVIAQEGRYSGSDADIDPSKLKGTAAYEAAGSIKFDKAKEQLWYGGNGPIEAFTQESNPVPDGTHDLEIPDFQHSLGSKYGDYATTWFRIGHSGDRYLHPGSVSLGCSTVRETGKWPDIWRYLIRRRKGDGKSVGTIEVV